MHDGLWCSVSDRWMGLLCEDLARKEKISKIEQDDYAFLSYQKAAKAQMQNWFQEEIISVRMLGDKKCDSDETIRRNISRDVFDTFESAFEHKGTVTAANSAAPCDGAAGCLLGSQKALERYSFQPLATIIACSSFAGSPKEVFSLQEQAIKVCLDKAGLSLAQIDLFEMSEAFATQMVFTQRQLNISDKKLNICGGDIALGHPLGAAGVRSLVTLVHLLKRKHKRYGLVCACLGGGGVLAAIIRRDK
jgi:acetyl-CoA C-acetyltransferase